jgi:predicted glycosyltransferase
VPANRPDGRVGKDGSLYGFASSTVKSSGPTGTTRPVKVWIDLDNTPHVPFFIPVIHELQRRGHQVVLTARDAFQVCELADQKGLRYLKVGRHHGKNSLLKALGLLWRSTQLLPFCLRHRPDIALSHGARSQIMLGNLLRIPTVLVLDYEHAQTPWLMRPRWEIVPDALPEDGVHSRAERVRKYRGIKEDVYAPAFKPDASLLKELGLRTDDLVVTVRPPANEAHYHNPEADALLVALMERLGQTSQARAVLLPRNKRQEHLLRDAYPAWFANGTTIVPGRAVDGLNLVWLSDLVVSGGGTMNREAAALGVPVYSIFRGKTGAVDRKLEQEGRLVMIGSVDDVRNKIAFNRRDKNSVPNNRPRAALQDIVDHFEDIVRLECR